MKRNMNLNYLFSMLLLAFMTPVFSVEIKNNDSFARVKKLGTLRVCSQAGFIPFEMKDSTGNWKGFDVDIMTKFTKQNSLKLQMIDTSLDGLIPSLSSGKCDFIASGLTITEERKRAVIFSKPVYTVSIAAALLDTPANKMKYKNFSDIDMKGIKVASHTGSAATLFLKEFLKNATHLEYDSESNEVNALAQKRANVFVEDDVFISQAAKKLQKMDIKIYALLSDEKGDLAMAARKSDTQLIEKFNEFLDEIKKNGEYGEIKKKYFD